MPRIKVLLIGLNVKSYYTLSLGYLKSYAEKDELIREKADIEIKQYELDAYPESRIVSYAEEFRPDIVGFSCYFWNSGQILNISRVIKEILPGCLVILGGPEASNRRESLIEQNHSVDIVVSGEGELTFAEILRSRIGGKSALGGIKGITYLAGGAAVSTPERELIGDLDSIPSPYLTDSFGGSFPGTPDVKMMIETYRGCAFRCEYCLEGKNYNGIRYFTPDRVAAEVGHLLDRGIRQFWLINSTYNLDKGRCIATCQAISRAIKGRDASFSVDIKAELIDSEIVQHLKEAKVNMVEIGLQSTYPETLKNISREFDATRFQAACALLRSAGIDFIIDIIHGLPGDNFFRWAGTVAFAMRCGPRYLEMPRLMLLPGTRLKARKDEFGMLYLEENPYYVLANYSFSSDELNRAEIFRSCMLKEYSSRND